MRLLLLVLTFGFVIASSASVEAAAAKKNGKKISAKKKHAKKKSVVAKAKASDAHLQTNHNFDDHGVTGEYQMPDEALARVENEKSLADLLGVRKHFKDRLAEASEQE